MSFFNTLSISDVKASISNLCTLMRKTANLTQAQLAEALGVSRITIQNLERGKNVTLDTLLKVFQYFGSLEKYQKFIETEIEDHNYKRLY